DSAYARQPGKMPPVYGIFLGRPSPDTLILDSISKLTGGRFFSVPSTRPDSLKSVMAKILNTLMRQYRPVGAVLANNSVSPISVGTASAGDFTRQGDAQWLFKFDRSVPLLEGQPNQIQ